MVTVTPWLKTPAGISALVPLGRVTVTPEAPTVACAVAKGVAVGVGVEVGVFVGVKVGVNVIVGVGVMVGVARKTKFIMNVKSIGVVFCPVKFPKASAPISIQLVPPPPKKPKATFPLERIVESQNCYK